MGVVILHYFRVSFVRRWGMLPIGNAHKQYSFATAKAKEEDAQQIALRADFLRSWQ